MSAVEDVDQPIEQFHLAQGKVVKGNPEPAKKLFSHREDVTLANPFGPPVRGWEQVAEVSDRATSNFRDGEMVGYEIIEKYVTAELTYVVELGSPRKPGPKLRRPASSRLRCARHVSLGRCGPLRHRAP